MSDLTLKERTTAAQTALQFQTVSQTGQYDFLTSDGRIEAHLDEEGSLILGTGELAKNFGKWVIKTRGQFGTIEQYNDEDETWFYASSTSQYHNAVECTERAAASYARKYYFESLVTSINRWWAIEVES